MDIHKWPPPKKVDLDKLRSITIAGAATPTRKANVNVIQKREKRWEADIPAYRRLRSDGLQPKRVDGASDVERKANEVHEVEGTINPSMVERAMNS